MIADAAACVGQFCDDMYLDCASPPAGIVPNQSSPFSATPLVSEENGSPAAKCPAGSVINGLIGDGSRSDNVSAICIPTAVNQATWAPLGVICNWTWWVSEEIGTTSWAYPGIGRAQFFGGGFGYATAVRCSGSFCDNMSYYACAAVNAYIPHEFSTQNDRGYTG